MNKELKISAENALAAYNNTDANGRELLEHLFGKDIFQPKDIRDRVKTFADAVEILGKDNQSVIDFHAVSNYILNYAIANKYCSMDILAYAKLRVIVNALNEGWNPTFNDDEYIYYPALYRYTKKEYDELNENQKKELILVGQSNIKLNANCGNIYAIEVCVSPYSVSSIGYHIALKTSELAKYCGKQFIDIWADFLFG